MLSHRVPATRIHRYYRGPQRPLDSWRDQASGEWNCAASDPPYPCVPEAGDEEGDGDGVESQQHEGGPCRIGEAEPRRKPGHPKAVPTGGCGTVGPLPGFAVEPGSSDAHCRGGNVCVWQPIRGVVKKQRVAGGNSGATACSPARPCQRHSLAGRAAWVIPSAPCRTGRVVPPDRHQQSRKQQHQADVHPAVWHRFAAAIPTRCQKPAAPNRGTVHR